MGLNVQVGILADLMENDEEAAEWMRDSLKNLNEVLAEHGLPKHDEPESIPNLDDRTPVGGFPYSFLHHLRRAYAHWKLDPAVPLTDSADTYAAHDPAIETVSAMMDSHLLCHSDAEGFYVPIDFPTVLFDEDRIAGVMLGSSYRLREELIAIADYLGIQLKDGELPDSEVEKISQEIESDAPFWIERLVWLALYEASRLSIQHKTAICFG